MCLSTAAKFLNAIAVAVGALSAFLWTRSAMVVVRSNRPDNHYRDGSTISGGTDFFATARLQAKWNRWAAAAAAVAALAQVGAAVIH